MTDGQGDDARIDIAGYDDTGERIGLTVAAFQFPPGKGRMELFCTPAEALNLACELIAASEKAHQQRAKYLLAECKKRKG